MKTIAKQPDGTVQFTIIIPKQKVKKAYTKTLDEQIKKTELKGFRKGMAPRDRVESHIGKQRLLTDTLQRILPEEYSNKVNELKLSPISFPKIEPKKTEDNSDWELFVTTVEKPKIELGNYKKAVTDAKKVSKIWVPGKDGNTKDAVAKDDKKQESADEQIKNILDALIQHVKFPLAKSLIEEDTNRLLSQLIQKLERLGLSLEQYLSSISKTGEQIRKEYKDQAERNVRLELILNEIAQDMEIKIEKSEIDKLVESVGDPKLKEKLDTPTERNAVRISLRKRKVLDNLMKL